MEKNKMAGTISITIFTHVSADRRTLWRFFGRTL